MNTVAEFLRRAADRNGFRRERFEERKVPTDHSALTVMPFFGDIRSAFVLSSLLLHRYREEAKGSKYFILASWPGLQGLFPYVDEYWGVSDEAHLKKFYEMAEGFRNKSDMATIYHRNLNEFFRDVVDHREITPLYDLGFKSEFFKRFKDTSRFLPFVPSVTVLGKEFTKELATRPGYKILLHPSLYAKQWHQGRAKHIRARKEFWIELCEFLLKNNYVPVVWQNQFSYDISQELVDRCLFIGEADVVRALAAMRATGCVLEVFNSMSRLAIAARCPYVAVDERSRNASLKEYEIDDLCAVKLPREYIFSFSTIISDGNPDNWKQDIFQSILKRLEKFLPELNRDEWPSTGESTEVVPYRDFVQTPMRKRLGTRLLKITRD
jgi:hypothetical protein